MNTPEHRTISLPNFVDLIQRYPTIAWMFRGQADATWPLRPKAGRPESFLPANDYWRQKGQSSSDLGRFNEWSRSAVAFCADLPTNDCERLAVAQHYGLATRLLDWSKNPLVALFFACECKPNADGAVFCHHRDSAIVTEHMSPADATSVLRFSPRPFDRRILVQAGLFTLHPRPEEPLEAEPLENGPVGLSPDGANLVCIRVIASYKSVLQRQLADIGITRMSLFPDLEGLSAFVNWETHRAISAKAGK